MKLLVAIAPENLASLDMSLRWASRGGYDLRVFVSKRRLAKAATALEDAAYNWYLNLENILVPNLKPQLYAQLYNYDLLLTIPAELEAWNKRKMFKDDEVFAFCEAVGKARLSFSTNPNKKRKRFANGAIMERIG